MSRLGGKVMSENTDADELATGVVETVVAGTDITISGTATDPIVNADAQDNAKVTTKGDLEGFSTVAARIPVGPDDDVLTVDSTAALGVAWKTPAAGGSAPDACKVSLSATLAGRGSSLTDVVFNTEDYDDTAYHSGTSARLTIPSGVTRVNLVAHVSFSSVTVGVESYIVIQRYNSSDVFQESVGRQDITTSDATYAISATMLGAECVATDYFIVRSFAADASHSVNTGTTFTIQNVTP